jgi:Kef-type K+ transport system membrane component KefB
VPHVEFVRLLVQLAVLLASANLLGRIARRFRAPAVVGELAAGIVLGPSVLGAMAPGFEKALFNPDGATLAARELLGRLGLLAFVFVAGLELEWAVLRTRARALACTAGLGIALPFASGVALAWNLPFDPAQSPGPPLPFMLFMGTALSISALPVIARILFDLGLQGSAPATLVLAAASIDDWIGWSLFGVVVALAGAAGASHDPAAAFVAGMVLTAGALLVGRPAVQRWRPWLRRRVGGVAGQLGAAATACLAAAAVAEALGTHALFGVFLLGACFAQGVRTREPVHEALEPFVTGVLSPIYFSSVGLRVDLGQHFDLSLALLVLGVATAAKLLGAGMGAWIGGLHPREALAVGVAMNARGAMEIVLASAARDCGLIGEGVYVALVLMALVTSLAAGPILGRLLRICSTLPRVPDPARCPDSAAPGASPSTA